ncbi:unnamed protein product [Caenorhabditis angaria]|uniref:Fungal lipase-type domain-containing protein n=1 Tax=Caenorhabditis angaria TaxID=860376 RepID=A0A9P1IN86_9PELO|nr:unnamed protein product [Caenorhabditis angaria]
MKFFLVLTAFLLISSISADSCENCLASGKHYCADVKLCAFSPCLNTITHALNCPSLPNSTFAYDDNVARTQWLPLFGAGATNGPNAQKCFDNNWPTMKLSKRILVNCSDPSLVLPETQCSMITAVDQTKQILVMSFRGTVGGIQLGEEFLNYFQAKKKFFDSGEIFEFFYDAYLALWQGGLEQEMRNLKYKYPNYEVWVTGHSLGGALASIGASWIVKAGLFQSSKIKLLTVGQPRTGDYDYSMWHQNTFAYSYRVVHHRDLVPHVPFQYEISDKDKMYHHRTEIWYNNNMTIGSTYHVCAEADGFYCSNQQPDYSWNDHMHYYNTDLGYYGGLGCPKN